MDGIEVQPFYTGPTLGVSLEFLFPMCFVDRILMTIMKVPRKGI
jgi:hypothetical protein